MERLTFVKCPKNWNLGHHPTKYSSKKSFQQVVGRLAAYENTGLGPEDFRAAFTEEACLKLTAQYLKTTPDRLRALALADGEGLLVVLPFLPNKDVWDYSEFFDGTPYAEYYKLNDSFIGVGVSANGKRTFEYDCFTIDPEQIGKTIFLTREEAEAALKGSGHE